jgi:hypothetical protein
MLSVDPFYYSWVFKPQDGDVELFHAWDEHPAFVRAHPDIASSIFQPNLIHGYAYRIQNGWRITDWEHASVDDPFIKRKVLEALKDVGQKSTLDPAPQ